MPCAAAAREMRARSVVIQGRACAVAAPTRSSGPIGALRRDGAAGSEARQQVGLGGAARHEYVAGADRTYACGLEVVDSVSAPQRDERRLRREEIEDPVGRFSRAADEVG